MLGKNSVRAWVCLGVVATFLLSACGDRSEECAAAPDVSGSEVNVEIVRLDQMMSEVETKADIKNLMKRYPLFTEEFLQRSQRGDESLLVDQLHAMTTDPHLDTLEAETAAFFGDMSDIQNDLNQAFSYLKYHYPDAPIPTVYTIVSGFGTDLFASDSILVIGLEYFMDDGEGRQPTHLYEYMRRRYQKRFLLPSVMTLLSSKYNQVDASSNSLLSEMVYYGKAYQFVKSTLPCVADSLIIGYTPDEMDDVTTYRKVIWSHFVDQQLLFKTDQQSVSRYVGERPYVSEISRKCPGRIGRWLGWRIVGRYQEKTGATLPELMQQTNAQEMLQRSGYKPEE
ncbi:MAG: gliding motility lipoprotein GldB [Catalinimonas sp.]